MKTPLQLVENLYERYEYILLLHNVQYGGWRMSSFFFSYTRMFFFGVPNWKQPLAHAERLPEPEYHVARANADSHSRRSEAINAKRRQDRGEGDGPSKGGGGFKAW